MTKSNDNKTRSEEKEKIAIDALEKAIDFIQTNHPEADKLIEQLKNSINEIKIKKPAPSRKAGERQYRMHELLPYHMHDGKGGDKRFEVRRVVGVDKYGEVTSSELICRLPDTKLGEELAYRFAASIDMSHLIKEIHRTLTRSGYVFKNKSGQRFVEVGKGLINSVEAVMEKVRLG